MSTRQVVRERIIDTSLGTLKVTLTKISGFDVDDLVSQRTRSGGVKRQLFALGQESAAENNANTPFPTEFIDKEGDV